MLERGRAFRHPRPRRHGAHARGGSQDRLRALHGRPARSSTATHHQAERVDGPAKQGVARRFADRPVRLQRTATPSRLTSLGSIFLAASAEVNGASRSSASPDFVGPPWLALRAEGSREGVNKPGERPGTRERAEPPGIAEAPEDLGRVARADTRDRAQDVCWVKGAPHHLDALLQFVDLVSEAEREWCLDREIVRQLPEESARVGDNENGQQILPVDGPQAPR